VIARRGRAGGLLRARPVPRDPDDITLFKNGGGAHLDLMTCAYILDRWRG
jgi:ornithine cyclodeaminase/alanine dehydrogenase-like protein (mu-crystallin family)